MDEVKEIRIILVKEIHVIQSNSCNSKTKALTRTPLRGEP